MIRINILSLIFGLIASASVYAQDDEFGLDWRGLLKNSEVRRDLEIANHQRDELEQRMSELRAEFKEKRDVVGKKWLNLQHGKGGDKNEIDLLRNQLNDEVQEKYLQALSEVLLPFQVERLEQLAYQLAANSFSGYESFLKTKRVRRQLEIDSDQSAKIKEKNEKLQKEFEKELAKLKQKYREKLNQCLNIEQRERLKKLLGESSSIDGGPTIRF